ncbi:arrestin domain-containing protein 3-like [Dunckerocampus dactyliophorus]|uniref:arrestin domain-containing protein 3-like n=1 Tax=Dunckerocampus dactyliophorus TaxID=161453 RepID=UPI00240522BF|nr:arrestin domain-containing protein 3-like [Dunckerocampus dactyliophorus]
MTIKDFSIEYDSINSQNIFTNGDTMNGRIIVEVSKETEIQSLTFIGKGKAKVRWHEQHGQHDHRYYWSDEKYYDVKQYILKDGNKIITKGRHVFPFTFMIPDRKMPSSFSSGTGRIVHKVNAELKQSMKLTKTAKAHFTFVSRADMEIPGLMEPQHDCTDKSLSVFGSGTVSMDVHTSRMGYQQGDALQLKVEIHNQSSRAVKPKFILYEKQSFFAQGHRRLYTKEILKEKVEAIDAHSKETVKKMITIPRVLPSSILNCSIIKLEYRLKIFLDIKYAVDPKIKLPIIVLPAFEVPDIKQPPGPAAFGFETFANSNQPTWSQAPQHKAAPQPLDPPPPYAAHAAYPPSSHSDKARSLL